MTYYHPEEEFQVWELEGYAHGHPESRYLIQFSDGESYECVYSTAYDSENGGELDIEEGHPLYDEFHQVSMQIVRIVQKGLRPYNEWLNLDYRDWPARIVDVESGFVVYPMSGSPLG